MIKVDSSCGGYGVFECSNEFDIQKINSEFLKASFLVQKKIMGIELDLSEFYLNSQLINFPVCPIDIRDGDPRKAGRDSCRVSVSRRDKGLNFCYCVIEKVVRKFGASSLRN